MQNLINLVPVPKLLGNVLKRAWLKLYFKIVYVRDHAQILKYRLILEKYTVSKTVTAALNTHPHTHF